MSLEIRIATPGGSTLAEEYSRGSSQALASYFQGSPRDLAAYRAKAEEVDGRFDAARRARMAEAIRPTSEAAAVRLARLVDEGGVLVTTGQQAGLFTGPLYTIHKILSAIALARALEPLLERPVLPLFWIASEDHDWEEVDHVHVLDRANELRRIELPDAVPGRLPSMSARPVGEGIRQAISELGRALPDTEYSPELLGLLERAYRPEASMAAAFEEVVAELFAPFDLLLADAAHPAIKELGRDVLLGELRQGSDHRRLLEERSAALRSAGYHVQVPILPEASNLFLEGPAGRERLMRSGEGFELRRSNEQLSGAEIERRIREAPESVSPNVVLRPVVESAVFPTVAYVAGPGELAYFAQIGCLFEAHGLRMPLVFPRFGALLIEGKVSKVLEKFDLEPEEFERPLHQLAARVVREEMPEDVSRSLAELRRGIAEGYAGLSKAARRVEPTLEAPIGRARSDALDQISQIEKKVVHHLREQHEVALRQLEKVAVNLRPLDSPQERVLNGFQYLVRYGRGLLDLLLAGMQERVDLSGEAWQRGGCPESLLSSSEGG